MTGHLTGHLTGHTTGADTGHGTAPPAGLLSRLRPSLVLLVVLVLLGVGLGAATVQRPEVVALDRAPDGSAEAGAVAVSSATLVCPDAGSFGGDSATDVTVVAPGLAPGATEGTAATGESRATVEPLTSGSSPLVTLSASGPAATATVRSADLGPVAVRSVGRLAQGLSAVQLTSVGAGEATGLAGTPCLEPATEWWFLGIGTEIGHRPRLSLVNAEPAVAEVDVVLHGPDGLLDTPSLSDIVVPAMGGTTVELDTVAPDLAELAVSVRVRVGRVVAAVRDSEVVGLDSRGVDWVAGSQPPSTRIVVPGVAAGSGPRPLQLLAPGELDTRAAVRLLSASGSIVPAGLEAVDLVAGAVTTVDLAEFTAGEVTAVELVADEPLVAGLRVEAAATGDSETAYTAASAPLTGPAVVPDVRTGDGWSGRLVLTADDGGTARVAAGSAQVSVEYVDAASGEVLAMTPVEIPTGTTVEVPLVPDGEAGTEPADPAAAPLRRFSVIVTPVVGDVVGVVRLDRSGASDAGFTLATLFSPQLEVQVPAVRQDLSIGLRPVD